MQVIFFGSSSVCSGTSLSLSPRVPSLWPHPCLAPRSNLIDPAGVVSWTGHVGSCFWQAVDFATSPHAARLDFGIQKCD
jgi:hypothetical protein